MNKLRDEAIRLTELGYSVFPCMPGAKIPKTEHGVLDASDDYDTVDQWWAKWPEANIGLSTKGLLVVDIDGKDNKWGKDKDFGAAPLGLTANKGRHYIFQQGQIAHRNTAGLLADHVDTRADGGYIIVPPSVLGDGKKYRWHTLSEICERSELPVVPDWLEHELAMVAKAKADQPLAIQNAIPKGVRDNALIQLGGYLRKAGLEEPEIFAALEAFNTGRCQPPKSQDAIKRIAHSAARYEPDQVTTALIECHWQQDQANAQVGRVHMDPGPLPDRFLNVPGFVNQVIEHNLLHAHIPRPELALAGALSLQAVLAARKVCDYRGNRTNVYIIGVAPSGGGKEYSRKLNRNILHQSGLIELEGQEDFASDSGILSIVADKPAVMFQVDEIGRMLRTLTDSRNAHLFNIMTLFMKLYSCADTVYKGKAYADSSRNAEINQPCVILHGHTVPEHLYKSMTLESLLDGFMARLILFETAIDDPEPNRAAQPPIPMGILEKAKAWGDYRPGGNLSSTSTGDPCPTVMPYTQEAYEVFEDLGNRIRKMPKPDGATRALFARVEEKACRLAMIYACSRGIGSQVDQEAAQWACDLSEYLTTKTLYLASQWVAEGAFDAKQMQLKRFIIENGGQISSSDLCRKAKRFSSRERSELLMNLEETGQVVRETTETGGRPKILYKVVK